MSIHRNLFGIVVCPFFPCILLRDDNMLKTQCSITFCPDGLTSYNRNVSVEFQFLCLFGVFFFILFIVVVVVVVVADTAVALWNACIWSICIGFDMVVARLLFLCKHHVLGNKVSCDLRNDTYKESCAIFTLWMWLFSLVMDADDLKCCVCSK